MPQNLNRRYNGPEAQIQADLLADTSPAPPPQAAPPTDIQQSSGEVLSSAVASASKLHPAEMEAVAQSYLLYSRRSRLVFRLPVGDIMFKHLWSSHPLATVGCNEALLLRVRVVDMSFLPRVGATLLLAEERSDTVITVQCLASISEYEGVDMLVFLVLESASMHKEGRIGPGTPSAVSGKPSNTIRDGEPIVKGEVLDADVALEKAAAAALAAHALKSAGFDRIRS